MIATAITPDSLPVTLQTVDAFEQWEREHPTGRNYEFVNGNIIPKPARKQNEIFIASFISRLFHKTGAYEKGDELLPEIDSYVNATRKRIPDLTYFTVAQKEAIRRGERVQTHFAIDILSD